MARIRRRPRRRRGDEGAVAAETLLALPILVGVVFLALQAALWGFDLIGVRAAADAAARDGAAYGATLADARASADQRMHQLVGPLLTGGHIDVSETVTTVTVVISGRSLLGVPVTWTATAPANASPEDDHEPRPLPPP